MSEFTELLREKNRRQIFEEMERTSKSREDLLLEKMDAHAKICSVCKFFCEHRIPEQIEEYGDFTGFCYYDDKGQERFEEFGVVPDDLIVNHESTCSRFESIFPQAQDEALTPEEKKESKRRETKSSI